MRSVIRLKFFTTVAKAPLQIKNSMYLIKTLIPREDQSGSA
jgi:hypothetical protein